MNSPPPELTRLLRDLEALGVLVEGLPRGREKGAARGNRLRRQFRVARALGESLGALDSAGAPIEAGWLATLEKELTSFGRALRGEAKGVDPAQGKDSSRDPKSPGRSRERRIQPEEQEELIGSMLQQVPAFLEGELEASVAAEAERAEREGREAHEVLSLPVLGARDRIVGALREHQVVLLQGETGSGKTLLSPFFGLEAGLAAGGRGIVHTQPRRVAARQVSRRMSEMAGTDFGGPIGCQTRLDKDFGPRTFVKVCTDGILLQEMKGDPDLSRYGLVIVDEAHERSLNIDLILGLLVRLLERRKDLRVLVTSATLEQERFRSFFDLPEGAVVTVAGRLFPVEIVHRDPLELLEEDDGPEAESDVALWAAREVGGICERREPGDILVFLPRVKEIRATMQWLERRNLPGVRILPMHGRLTPEENSRVFETSPLRKIVVATHIAETSITVPGVRHVIDCGQVNEKRYDPKVGITSLFPVPNSVASSDQRAGRAGRVEEGVCIRLWSEEEHETRSKYTQPEILRSDLAHLVLLMRDLGIDHIKEFPFLDRPEPQRFFNARQTLIDLGALTEEDELTPLGRRIARLPLDPRVGRMVLAGEERGCLDEVLSLAACLSVSREPFLAPRLSDRDGPGIDSQRRAVKEIKGKLADGGSDFDAVCALFETYRGKRWKERRAFCGEHRASLAVLGEIAAVRHDLVDAVRRGGMKLPKRRESVGKKQLRGVRDAVTKSILSGLVSHVAVRDGKYDYRTAGRAVVFIHPGSVLFDREKRPKVLVAQALEEGENRTFARQVAGIPPKWLEEVAPHLVSLTHREKRFDVKTGKVLAYENVYFRELTLQEDVEVDLFDRDEGEAMRVLVREGLLGDQLGLGLDFREENEKVLNEIIGLADRIGDRSFVPDEESIVRFYARKLAGCRTGHDVVRRVGRRGESGLLRMRVEDFVGPEELRLAAELYPEEVEIGGVRCPVEYVHNPWNERTTLTIRLSETAFSGASPGEADRAVPGWARLLDRESEEEELSMRLVLQVVADDGAVRAEATTQAALGRSLGQDQVREAWEAARERFEAPASEQFHDVPRLLSGVCESVVVCMDPGGEGSIEAWPGLLREGRGFARRLFRAEAEATQVTRDALCEYVRLLLALRPGEREELLVAGRIASDLETRFEKVTGRTGTLEEALGTYVMKIAGGTFLDAADFQGGGEAVLARLQEQRERAVRFLEEGRPVLDDAILACATLRKRLAGRKVAEELVEDTQAALDRATEALKTFDRNPPEAIEAVRTEIREWTRRTK